MVVMYIRRRQNGAMESEEAFSSFQVSNPYFPLSLSLFLSVFDREREASLLLPFLHPALLSMHARIRTRKHIYIYSRASRHSYIASRQVNEIFPSLTPVLSLTLSLSLTTGRSGDSAHQTDDLSEAGTHDGGTSALETP